MGRHRIYRNDSEKTAAYRARKRERERLGQVAAGRPAVTVPAQELRKSITALAQTCERARQQLGIEEKKKWPWRIKSPVVVVGRLIEYLEHIESELIKLAAR